MWSSSSKSSMESVSLASSLKRLPCLDASLVSPTVCLPSFKWRLQQGQAVIPSTVVGPITLQCFMLLPRVGGFRAPCRGWFASGMADIVSQTRVDPSNAIVMFWCRRLVLWILKGESRGTTWPLSPVKCNRIGFCVPGIDSHTSIHNVTAYVSLPRKSWGIVNRPLPHGHGRNPSPKIQRVQQTLGLTDWNLMGPTWKIGE
jgi:hypothetical protein